MCLRRKPPPGAETPSLGSKPPQQFCPEAKEHHSHGVVDIERVAFQTQEADLVEPHRDRHLPGDDHCRDCGHAQLRSCLDRDQDLGRPERAAVQGHMGSRAIKETLGGAQRGQSMYKVSATALTTRLLR